MTTIRQTMQRSPLLNSNKCSSSFVGANKFSTGYSLQQNCALTTNTSSSLHDLLSTNATCLKRFMSTTIPNHHQHQSAMMNNSNMATSNMEETKQTLSNGSKNRIGVVTSGSKTSAMMSSAPTASSSQKVSSRKRAYEYSANLL